MVVEAPARPMPEVDLHADLHQPRLQDGQRLLPARVVVVERQAPCSIERVEEIEVHRRRWPPNFRIFAKRRSTWFNRSPYSVPGSTRATVTFGGVARQAAAERRRDQRVRRHVGRDDLRAGNALERAADLHVHPRHRVGAEELHLREEMPSLTWQTAASSDCPPSATIVAVVGHRAAGADAALQQQPAAEPRVDASRRRRSSARSACRNCSRA